VADDFTGLYVYVVRDRKLSISYKGQSQLPKEPELRELKLFVGMLTIFTVLQCLVFTTRAAMLARYMLS